MSDCNFWLEGDCTGCLVGGNVSPDSCSLTCTDYNHPQIAKGLQITAVWFINANRLHQSLLNSVNESLSVSATQGCLTERPYSGFREAGQQQICDFWWFISGNCSIIGNRLHIIANLTPFISKLTSDWLHLILCINNVFCGNCHWTWYIKGSEKRLSLICSCSYLSKWKQHRCDEAAT